MNGWAEIQRGLLDVRSNGHEGGPIGHELLRGRSGCFGHDTEKERGGHGRKILIGRL